MAGSGKQAILFDDNILENIFRHKTLLFSYGFKAFPMASAVLIYMPIHHKPLLQIISLLLSL